ncbi:MAG: hypothetical protein ACTTJK_04370 [Phocaeicola sp.]|uniref:hypothetical protein n=1 Tax=Phocaeicola sp. TaxID=2773926 RepID=UPI003F9FDE91
MKKVVLSFFVLAVLISSCYGTMTGSPAAVSAGASIGGVLGSIIGDNADGWRGSQFGSLIGTVAGAAIGNAVSTPPKDKQNEGDYQEKTEQGYDDIYSDENGYVNNESNLEIRNIRFIDDSRNQAIEAGESAKIVFDIVNVGNSPSYNIVPVIKELNKNKHLKFSPSRPISYMPQGNQIRYTMTIRADKRLRDGMAQFRIYAIESNGAVTAPHDFSIEIRRR